MRNGLNFMRLLFWSWNVFPDCLATEEYKGQNRYERSGNMEELYLTFSRGKNERES